MIETTYKAYLASKQWRKRRHVAIEAAGGRCEACGAEVGLTVHHLTYANVGEEPPEDLMVLCKECHNILPWHDTGPSRAETLDRIAKVRAGWAHDEYYVEWKARNTAGLGPRQKEAWERLYWEGQKWAG